MADSTRRPGAPGRRNHQGKHGRAGRAPVPPSRLRVPRWRTDNASVLPGPVLPDLEAVTAPPEPTAARPAAVEEEADYQADRAAGFPCRCGRTWTGVARCHCATCHASFSSISAFDRHRRGFQCHPPEECGLVRRGDYWSLPGERPEVSL
jgi:hypothetical protein